MTNRAYRVGIIGVGNVGAHLARELLKHPQIVQLNLSRRNVEELQGIGYDLEDAVATDDVGRIVLNDGDYDTLKRESDIVVVCLKNPDYDYRDLISMGADLRVAPLRKDSPLITEVAEGLQGFGGYVVNISNPTEVTTRAIQDIAGLDPGRVFSFGTALDAQRHQGSVRRLLGLRSQEVHDVYFIGSHSPLGVPLNSQVRVNGASLHESLDQAIAAHPDFASFIAAQRVTNGTSAADYFTTLTDPSTSLRKLMGGYLNSVGIREGMSLQELFAEQGDRKGFFTLLNTLTKMRGYSIIINRGTVVYGLDRPVLSTLEFLMNPNSSDIIPLGGYEPTAGIHVGQLARWNGRSIEYFLPLTIDEQERIAYARSIQALQKAYGEQRGFFTRKPVLTLLLADDQRGLVELLERTIYRCYQSDEELSGLFDLRIVKATNGRDAVNPQITGEGIDIAVLDIRMPDQNGVRVAEQLRRANPHLRLVIHSAYLGDLLRDQNIKADVCIDKGTVNYGDLWQHIRPVIMNTYQTYGKHRAIAR
ncbi:response regulator [Candidatus Peregrinibacteria bacterium]|nr:response regulator [Candidatus Peregrinibacteria bacterium]